LRWEETAAAGTTEDHGEGYGWAGKMGAGRGGGTCWRESRLGVTAGFGLAGEMAREQMESMCQSGRFEACGLTLDEENYKRVRNVGS
jgi:hypothetical protein